MVKVRHNYIYSDKGVDSPFTIGSGCRARLLLANSHWRWMGSVDNLSSCLLLFAYRILDRSIKSQAETNIASYIDETKNRAEQATEHIPNPPRALSVARIRERSSFPLLPPLPHAGTGTCPTRVSLSRNIITTNEHQDGVDFEGLIQSGKITVKVTNVRKDFVDSPLTALDLRLKTNVTQDEVIQAVKDAGAFLTILLINFLHV